MRVVCDQCAATYRVPNARLTKDVNKATCRTCGARLLIPRPAPNSDDEERVVVPAIPATQGMGDSGHVAPGIEDDDDKTVPIIDRTRSTRIPDVDDIPLLSGAPIGRAEREAMQRAKVCCATRAVLQLALHLWSARALAPALQAKSKAVVMGLLWPSRQTVEL